ncbi:hypothetical protein MRX96_047127 [Rhipicephalus microplus]
MATQDPTGPGATRRSTTGDHCRGHLVIPPTLLRTAGLPPPVETMVRCFRGQYSHSILTALATTAEPVQKHNMILSKLPRFRDRIDWEVAWDEQLLTLLSPTALRTTATAPGSFGGILACLLTLRPRAA